MTNVTLNGKDLFTYNGEVDHPLMLVIDDISGLTPWEIERIHWLLQSAANESRIKTLSFANDVHP